MRRLYVRVDVQFVIAFSDQQIQKFLIVSLFLADRNVFHEGGQVLKGMAGFPLKSLLFIFGLVIWYLLIPLLLIDR